MASWMPIGTLKGGDQQVRITGFMDRGVLKFRIHRKGKVIGWLTLDGLVKWMESQRPTTPGKVVGLRNQSF